MSEAKGDARAPFRQAQAASAPCKSKARCPKEERALRRHGGIFVVMGGAALRQKPDCFAAFNWMSFALQLNRLAVACLAHASSSGRLRWGLAPWWIRAWG